MCWFFEPSALCPVFFFLIIILCCCFLLLSFFIPENVWPPKLCAASGFQLVDLAHHLRLLLPLVERDSCGYLARLDLVKGDAAHSERSVHDRWVIRKLVGWPSLSSLVAFSCFAQFFSVCSWMLCGCLHVFSLICLLSPSHPTFLSLSLSLSLSFSLSFPFFLFPNAALLCLMSRWQKDFRLFPSRYAYDDKRSVSKLTVSP